MVTVDEAHFKSAVVVSNNIDDTVAVVTAGTLWAYYVKFYDTANDYVNGLHNLIEGYDEYCAAYSAAYSWCA